MFAPFLDKKMPAPYKAFPSYWQPFYGTFSAALLLHHCSIVSLPGNHYVLEDIARRARVRHDLNSTETKRQVVAVDACENGTWQGTKTWGKSTPGMFKEIITGKPWN
jgi:hypothetical protein